MLAAAAGGKGGIPADPTYIDALLTRVLRDDLGVSRYTVLAGGFWLSLCVPFLNCLIFLSS